MGDGSGLSRRDWLTPAQVAILLQAAQSRSWFTTWYAALPVAGDPSPLVRGTLARRMRGTPAAGNLRAKTGTLWASSPCPATSPTAAAASCSSRPSRTPRSPT